MNLTAKKCIPCEAGTKPLTKQDAERYLPDLAGWEIVSENQSLRIRKRFQFDSYLAGIDFVNQVAQLAEDEDHHPTMFVGFGNITVNLTTHAIGGLSENDFIMAAKINQIKL